MLVYIQNLIIKHIHKFYVYILSIEISRYSNFIPKFRIILNDILVKRRYRLSNEKNPGYFLYIGNYTTQSYGDYFINHAIRIPINQAVYWKVRPVFFSWLTWDVQNLVNHWINYQPQLVFPPDFSHQQYHICKFG